MAAQSPRTHARPSDTLERLTLLSTMPRASRSKAADQDTDMVADEVVRPRGRSRRRSSPHNAVAPGPLFRADPDLTPPPAHPSQDYGAGDADEEESEVRSP